MRISEAVELLQRTVLHPDTEVVMEFYDVEDVANRLNVTTDSLRPVWSQVVERWGHTAPDPLTTLSELARQVADEEQVELHPEATDARADD